MRKHIRRGLILTALLCLLLLSGCGKDERIYGEVVEAYTDGDGILTSFVVHTIKGEYASFLVTEETSILSSAEGLTADEFRHGRQTDAIVSIARGWGRQTVTGEDGKKNVFYKVHDMWITGWIDREAELLPDGTPVDLAHEMFYDVYRLADGTELLRIKPFGPNSLYISGLEGFRNLPEAVLENIQAYYEEQGPLYDARAELEKAYDAYLKKGPRAFEEHYASQSLFLSAYSDQVLYIQTEVTLPIDGTNVYDLSLGAAFDRETGEHIDNTKLFSLPAEEVTGALLDIARIGDLRLEMEAAFRPEYIVLYSEEMELRFPRGTLPSEENGCVVMLDLNGELLDILHEWAIPER